MQINSRKQGAERFKLTKQEVRSMEHAAGLLRLIAANEPDQDTLEDAAIAIEGIVAWIAPCPGPKDLTAAKDLAAVG